MGVLDGGMSADICDVLRKWHVFEQKNARDCQGIAMIIPILALDDKGTFPAIWDVATI